MDMINRILKEIINNKKGIILGFFWGIFSLIMRLFIIEDIVRSVMGPNVEGISYGLRLITLIILAPYFINNYYWGLINEYFLNWGDFAILFFYVTPFTGMLLGYLIGKVIMVVIKR